jgi:hypothetical protein
MFILLFFFPRLSGRKRKGEKNNQSHGQINAFLLDHYKQCFIEFFSIILSFKKVKENKGFYI